ncbi:hypothetical protein [Microbacterium sp. LWH11-1.2]|uniref:hypothetical protein n=1 Tax=Microbacterium sp. LWH11-1.2 TaxID=3135258 RepID=UPI003139369C
MTDQQLQTFAATVPKSLEFQQRSGAFRLFALFNIMRLKDDPGLGYGPGVTPMQSMSGIEE